MNDTWTHITAGLMGATVLSIVAHAVTTFPVPNNAYGQWLLGVIQYAVGQRLRGSNTMKGETTVVSQASALTPAPKPSDASCSSLEPGSGR